MVNSSIYPDILKFYLEIDESATIKIILSYPTLQRAGYDVKFNASDAIDIPPLYLSSSTDFYNSFYNLHNTTMARAIVENNTVTVNISTLGATLTNNSLTFDTGVITNLTNDDLFISFDITFGDTYNSNDLEGILIVPVTKSEIYIYNVYIKDFRSFQPSVVPPTITVEKIFNIKSTIGYKGIFNAYPVLRNYKRLNGKNYGFDINYPTRDVSINDNKYNIFAGINVVEINYQNSNLEIVPYQIYYPSNLPYDNYPTDTNFPL